MASARSSEAQRLRRHNREFRYALEHGITVLEARRRIAAADFAALEQRVHPPLKPAIGLCGTAAPASHADEEPAQPHYWWQDR